MLPELIYSNIVFNKRNHILSGHSVIKYLKCILISKTNFFAYLADMEKKIFNLIFNKHLRQNLLDKFLE